MARGLGLDLEQLVGAALGVDGAALGRRIQLLWGGYGEIRRVALRGGSVPSVVVKCVTPPPAAEVEPDAAALRSHRRKLRSYDVERAFYARYAERCGPGCRVARALHLEPLENGWLFVLEDLDAAGFDRRLARPSEREIAACLAWLAEFHATFLGERPAALWASGSYWHLATRPDELDALSEPTLRDAAPLLDAALDGAQFRTFVHGDAKLQNFCFDRRGAVAAVDFQYVGGGPGIKDVAYFLSSCLSPAACESSAPRYLDVYFEALARAVESRAAGIDAGALEQEWRSLYPVAWADFYRFLLGWSKERVRFDAYSRRLTEQALARVGC